MCNTQKRTSYTANEDYSADYPPGPIQSRIDQIGATGSTMAESSTAAAGHSSSTPAGAQPHAWTNGK